MLRSELWDPRLSFSPLPWLVNEWEDAPTSVIPHEDAAVEAAQLHIAHALDTTEYAACAGAGICLRRKLATPPTLTAPVCTNNPP